MHLKANGNDHYAAPVQVAPTDLTWPRKINSIKRHNQIFQQK